MVPDMTKVTRYPACFVVNSDTSQLPGEHWIAFYYTDIDNSEFFDSYGLSPLVYGFDVDSLYSSRCLQSSTSTVCGQYCIYFLYHRSLKHSFHTILNAFSNSVCNDILVAKFVKRLSKISNPILNSFHHCNNQCCKARYHS